ncbi:gp31 [Sphingomonas phage PAU]|uniref:gp31 n=1 Tax=Sphingomonas phage PAU TaxID=1150991 RepID=UPI0002573124|nr:gp31 [Sphingomonas phage PAU]AFF28029.1 gp31 [Sphingomonas phage PAU]
MTNSFFLANVKIAESVSYDMQIMANGSIIEFNDFDRYKILSSKIDAVNKTAIYNIELYHEPNIFKIHNAKLIERTFEAKSEIRFFVHTQKAINNGCPNDRIFLTVSEESGFFVAWKLQFKNGLLSFGDHSFNGKYSLDEAIIKGKTWNSKDYPTAHFKKDSFYKEISLESVKKLISC